MPPNQNSRGDSFGSGHLSPRFDSCLKGQRGEHKLLCFKISLLSLSLEVTRGIAVSETSAAQVDSPLVPHVFLHQTVEHKNKEAWDRKEKTRED